MKKTLIWCGRVTKEILRDPLSLIFGIGFPVVLLLLLSAIQSNVPVEIFALEELTPGIAFFGLSFLALFSAQLVARDRATFVLGRMFTTPIRAHHFILGYTLPLIPMVLVQGMICYALALILGLEWTPNIFLAILSLLPAAAFYIGIGLLCGSAMSEKAATSLCGALLTNVSAFLSGAWFSLEMVGKTFQSIVSVLPFPHAVELGRAVLSGKDGAIVFPLAVVCAYALAALGAAVAVFEIKMKN